MPFNKTNTKDVLRDLQQNIIIPFHTVHDEIDVIISEHILTGVSKRMVEMGTIKNIFDRIGIPYINYLFDVETNANGSWIPNKKDEVTAYREPSCEREYLALQRLKEIKADVEMVEINLESISEIKKDILYSIDGIVLKIVTPKRTYFAPRLVDKKSIIKYIKGN